MSKIPELPGTPPLVSDFSQSLTTIPGTDIDGISTCFSTLCASIRDLFKVDPLFNLSEIGSINLRIIRAINRGRLNQLDTRNPHTGTLELGIPGEKSAPENRKATL